MYILIFMFVLINMIKADIAQYYVIVKLIPIVGSQPTVASGNSILIFDTFFFSENQSTR